MIAFVLVMGIATFGVVGTSIANAWIEVTRIQAEADKPAPVQLTCPKNT